MYLFLARGEGREKERETSMCGCLLCAPYWGPDLACNPDMGPDWALNRDPLVCRSVLSPLSHTSQGQNLFPKLLDKENKSSIYSAFSK